MARMGIFRSIDDDLLADRIAAARDRIVYVAPAVTLKVVEALSECLKSAGAISLTIILDPGEEPYRLGYGDPEALSNLQLVASESQVGLRAQLGLRIGLLLTDDRVLIWSPTPRSVEAPHLAENGLEFAVQTLGRDGMEWVARRLRDAVGADDGEVLIQDADIGRRALTVGEVEATRSELENNPPAPFDLTRRTRVFATGFQFVEAEVRGLAWGEREFKLSSLLINADFPGEFQDHLETRVRPFAAFAALAVPAPVIFKGELVYRGGGEPFVEPRSQAEMLAEWRAILGRYLHKVGRFGSLIDRRRKAAFVRELDAFQTALKEWAANFARAAAEREDELVRDLVDLVMTRASSSPVDYGYDWGDVEAAIRDSLKRARTFAPEVRHVFKDVSWESTQDGAFKDVLRVAVPPEALEGWFETYTAAPERR